MRQSGPLLLLGGLLIVWSGGRLAYEASVYPAPVVDAPYPVPHDNPYAIRRIARPADPSIATGDDFLVPPNAATRWRHARPVERAAHGDVTIYNRSSRTMAAFYAEPTAGAEAQALPPSIFAEAQRIILGRLFDRPGYARFMGAGRVQPTVIAMHSSAIWPGETAALAGAARPSAGGSAGNRWSGSSWLFIRGGADAQTAPLSPGPMLAGSQAGGRVAYRIDQAGRVDAFARITTAGRRGDGIEGAVGISYRPDPSVPIAVVVERRAAIAGDGGRHAFAAYATGGVDQLPLPAGWHLDGYAASGVVGARRRDPFAELAVQVTRPVATLSSMRISLGGAAFAAAQRDASRVDVGPMVAIRGPIASGSARLTIDYRARIAGGADPTSGAAITLATDF